MGVWVCICIHIHVLSEEGEAQVLACARKLARNNTTYADVC